jgi:osmoprotectant transport system permease protein
VQVVATAALGAVVPGGGLGRFIIDGFAARDFPQIFAGALLVAVLAILTEVGFSLLEKVVSPRMTTSRRRVRPEAQPWEQGGQVPDSQDVIV